MCRPVKLVGEDHSQVLMVLHKDDGLSLDFRGEARIDVSASWPMGGGGGGGAGALLSSVQFVRTKKKPSSKLP